MQIHVPMEVERYELRTSVGLVECWGCVGDYEIMLCISWKHAAEEGLITNDEWLKACKARRKK